MTSDETMEFTGLEESARSFWSWFESVENHLRELQPGSPAWIELDERVDKLGVEAWEIGPAVASTAKYSFTLSPNGDPEAYSKTKRIVALAPVMPAWEFLPAKPRKQWVRKFLWSEDLIDIDASGWRFVVYRYEDGLSEIVLLGDVLPALDSDTILSVLDFVVESELGEASYIALLYGIDVVREPTEQDVESSIPITSLFQSVVTGRHVH